jgi:hypothetical protein
MKKINWLYFLILIAVVTSCNKPVDEKKTSADDTTSQNIVNLVPTDTTRTVISLAQLVLDTLIESQNLLEETRSGSLKKLWKYDEQLYLTSNSSKKFIVTKEINPCCPCSSTVSECCACLIETDFAAVSDMQASATLDGADMKTTSTITGVDLFSIPSGTTGKHSLKISGASFSPVTYSVTIENGTIRFK